MFRKFPLEINGLFGTEIKRTEETALNECAIFSIKFRVKKLHKIIFSLTITINHSLGVLFV